MATLRVTITKVLKITIIATIMTPVLMTGENDSGKKLITCCIREQSNYADGLFLAANFAVLKA